ncbi:Ras-like protein 6 [Elsinoe fawcettii]|nr:Ras-like protein 6 [Elsinoe fawcettii]
MKFKREVNIGLMGHTGCGLERLIKRVCNLLPTQRTCAFANSPVKLSLGDKLEPDVYDPTFTTWDDVRKQFTVASGISILIQTMRITHKEFYTTLRDHLIKTSEAFILIYDVSSRESFEKLVEYHEMIYKEKGLQPDGEPVPRSPPVASEGSALRSTWRQKFSRTKATQTKPLPEAYPPAITVIANKIDLPKDSWQVTYEEGEAYSQKIGADFVALSARTGVNYSDKIYMYLATRAIAIRPRDSSTVRPP